MRNARHIGRAGGEYDKKFEFASPDARGSASRTAGHRYMPVEAREGRGGGSARAREEEFSQVDFRARWWPAPDVME
jgi:hypothetical protein